MLVVQAELKECKHRGLCLVADQDIKEGQFVWVDVLDPVMKVTRKELMSWPEEKRNKFLTYAWQDSDDVWSGTLEPEKDLTNFINHSCDPNIWFSGDYILTARRNIARGEELLLDYSTCDSDFLTIKSCKCGAKCCRGSVQPTDYIKMKSVYAGHFRQYLEKKLANV